ncbi:BQ5605_C017g08463 [Microbotryum silenes-dioicae]|uniref:BQ5605_C017g08463 protein n=1 Tax=Microbotryum silenes-dioicae TaxID=796604 RepID=A0A2X0NZ03_9BASI|nr:BQ5605_C017g08463 [Microbotryum silenes-dioicae]
MRPNPVVGAGSSSKKRGLSKVITLEDDEDEDEVVEEEDEDFNIPVRRGWLIHVGAKNRPSGSVREPAPSRKYRLITAVGQ